MPPPSSSELIPAAAPALAKDQTTTTDDDGAALVAMAVAQSVPAAPLLEQSSLSLPQERLHHSKPIQRVDFLGQDPRDNTAEEAETAEDSEEEHKGIATMWLKENQLMLTYFVAGGLAGAASRTVVSPLERLKIILQVQPREPAQPAGKKKAGSAKAYGGVWSSLVRMYKEEGYAGFMRGNGINCARWLKTYTGNENLSTPWRLGAGACAGIASVVSTYPLDLVRSRISIATASISMPRTPGMARTGIGSSVPSASASASASTVRTRVLDKDLGIWGMTRKVYRTEGGLKGLYRGTLATAAGVAPYVALNFYFYEGLKGRFIKPDDSTANKSVRTLCCGAAAGSVAQTLTYPFDVLRRKMQVAGMKEFSPAYNGALDAMIKITRAEGWWGGMYRGLWPNLLKVAPSMATSFFVYETVKSTITEHVQTL
ncbi:hypothetical protein QFC21_001735 [Naganishia friedmannii]|uniref:Uncharacterized protein n=1 Tax=Naganishia friedmannii TaxID=89922 RepID=A0ACC2W1W8_9TREE|nr:hypothetical protein QFC21_001735 [Naganishia friedmannii]